MPVKKDKTNPLDAGMFAGIYVDFRSHQLKCPKTMETFRQLLTQEFEENLDEGVERLWEMPSLAVKPDGAYLDLLLEARALFVAGHFYACVAMCGIVAERVLKDLLRTSVLIMKEGSPEVPADKVFDQFERVEVFSLINFLHEAGVLNEAATKAARAMSQLRNDYAHARGKKPKEDAQKALIHLHFILEGTVSVLGSMFRVKVRK